MTFFFFFNFLIYFYLWLCWVFVSVRGLSLVAASGGHSSSWCAGHSLSRALLLQSTGSRRAGSVVVVHGLRCSAACGIFPDQGSNPCTLHWQADSQPLRHQGSPSLYFFKRCIDNCDVCQNFKTLLHIGIRSPATFTLKYSNIRGKTCVIPWTIKSNYDLSCQEQLQGVNLSLTRWHQEAVFLNATRLFFSLWAQAQDIAPSKQTELQSLKD